MERREQDGLRQKPLRELRSGSAKRLRGLREGGEGGRAPRPLPSLGVTWVTHPGDRRRAGPPSPGGGASPGNGGRRFVPVTRCRWHRAEARRGGGGEETRRRRIRRIRGGGGGGAGGRLPTAHPSPTRPGPGPGPGPPRKAERPPSPSGPSGASGWAAAMAEPELSQLLDAAIGTPEVGSVNFTALRSLLQAMLGRLSLLEGDRAAQAAAGREQDGDRAQAVGQQLPEPREQLPGKDSVSGTASGPQLASVATDVGQMKEKVKENESGISKALEEIGGMKAAQTRMGEDIQAMQEALGLLQDKLQEAAGRLPGPRKQRGMDTDEESSGGHSPRTKPTLSHVDVQRRASSALGPEGAGGQAVPRSSEGTPGTQPGSLGMRAGSQESAVTTKKGTDAPADERRRRSDASTTAPGTQPGAAGIKTQTPGAQPGSAGVSPLRDPSMSRGSWGPSSIPPDESSVTLRGRVSSLQGQASDMQDETGKVRQLEDAFGKLGVSGDDLDVDGSERSTLQPGSTLQEIKKELSEVMELRLEQMKQELKDLGLEQMKRELKDLGLEQMKRELKDLGLEQMKQELKVLGLEQMKQELKVLGLEQMKQELKDLGLEQMKRELKELAEHQEISKATLKKLGAEMDKQLQAQQEKLRALESVGQEAAACPACSGDTRAQVGQLLQRYEKLQEAVDALLSRLAAYKVARHLPRRSQQDEELLKRLQATMVQVQGEHEKLSSIVGNMRDESHQKQKDTKALFQSLERLVKQKADKEDLELGIDVKADKSALAGKVNHAEFDARMERLKEMFQEMLSRVTGQEQLQQQLSEELAAKLDRLELGPFRQQLEGHWESILKQLQEKAAQAEDDDAAGIRKLLLAHFHCLSCDRPLDVRVPGPCIVTIPSSPPMPPRPTGQPLTVLKSEQEEQDGKREPPAEPRYPTVPRSCGGRHTVTTPLQRRQCLRPPPHLQHLLLPSKCNVVDLLAKDRRISRGRLEEPLPALRGTEEPSPGQPWPAPHQLGKPRPASHEPEEPKPTEPKPAQHKADWANGPLSLAPRPPRSRPSARPARPQHVFFKT